MNGKPSESGTNTNKVLRDDRGRWLPGQSPNPSGRPKGISITKLLRQLGDDEIMLEDVPMTKREAVARLIWSKALSGDKFFVGLLLDRCDGSVRPVVEQTGTITAADLKGKRIVIEQSVVDASGANMN